MLLLPCPGLAPLLAHAYKHFSRTLERNGAATSFEQAVDAPAPDLKNFRDYSFDQARYNDAPIAAVHDILQTLVEKYADELSRTLFPEGPALETLLGLPERNILRFTSYPAADQALVNHAHSDIDLFTVLPAASGDGFEIETADRWRAVAPEIDEVIVIAGEFTEMFGGRPAVRHRVRGTAWPRLSASFFVNPAPDLMILGRSVREITEERLNLVARKR